MPTITTVDPVWETGVTADAAELRRAESTAFLGDGSANGVRGGIVRHGDTSLAVSVNGSDQVTVQAGAAVIPAATGLGVYRASLSAATSATGLPPRNATNPRIDLVVMQIVSGRAEVKTIDGTPGSSPSAPALPANSVELGRINLPAVGGGAATVTTSFRQYATALGGTLVVETAARLPGSGNQRRQRAVALDTGADYFWTGSSWKTSGPTQVFSSADLTLTSDVTQIPNLNVVLDGAGTGTRFVAHVDLDVSVLNADNVVGWQLYVDNAPFGATSTLTLGVIGRWTTSRTYVVTGLAEGPHTFTVRANRTGTADGSIVRAAHSTLVIDVRP